MNPLFNILIFFIQNFLMKKMYADMKKKGLIVYLNVLQITRKSVTGAIFIFAFLQLMVFGFLGLIVTSVFLLPQDLDIKLRILFYTCLGLFIIPFFLLIYILSEKVWYKASRAHEMIDPH